jgi:hypothetical protein
MFGRMIILFIVAGYVPASIFFYLGGRRYADEYEKTH